MATILVVEEPVLRSSLSALLAKQGHKLLQANDGAEALAQVRSGCPDLVITAVLLPTMDGYELVRQLRSDPTLASTRVVFRTDSNHSPRASALAAACGVTRFLARPFDPAEILQTVAEALASPTDSPSVPPASFHSNHVRLLTEQLVWERQQTQENLARRLSQMQLLSRRLIETQEEERRNLALELHDELGQLLTLLHINLTMLLAQTAPDGRSILEESRRLVHRAMEQVRVLSYDLRPVALDNLGLEAALRSYLDRHGTLAGLTVELSSALGEQRLPAFLETVCFRVIQETFSNVVQHARASRFRVELTQDGEAIHLLIQDDGKGFDLADVRQRMLRGEAFGLLSTQERVQLFGGQIDLESAPGHGTTIRIRFPQT